MSFCIPTDEPDSVALPTLLGFGKAFQATDVRDKVHAIVGLIKRDPEQERCSLLEPDYRVPPVVVFVNVVKHFLECSHTENGRDLGILSGVFHSRGVPLTQDFPSWVPRWDLTSQSPRISEPGIYDACSSRSINLKEPISVSTMILKGFRVSKVVGVDTSLIDLWEEDEWVPGEIWKTVKRLWRAFTKKHLVYQGRELTSAFGKTITAGGVIMKEYSRPAEGDFTVYFIEELKKEQEKVPSSLQETIIGMLEANTELKIPESDPALLEEGDATRIFYGLMRNVVFTTSTGHFGTGDDTVEPGDLVCVLFGGNTPFILREIDNHYILVGECYVHGMMHGEAMAMLESGEVEEEWFELH
jgi:hypothetical protein